MAFTETQKTSIAKILFITKGELSAQILSLGSDLTSEDEQSIKDAIVAWDAGIGSNTIRIKAMEANFGAEINPLDGKDSVRAEIAILLGRRDWIEFTQNRVYTRSTSKSICFGY